jgi:hypothetical protein
MICAIGWGLVTDILEQHIGPFFKGQAAIPLEMSDLPVGADVLSRNVCIQLSTYGVQNAKRWKVPFQVCLI